MDKYMSSGMLNLYLKTQSSDPELTKHLGYITMDCILKHTLRLLSNSNMSTDSIANDLSSAIATTLGDEGFFEYTDEGRNQNRVFSFARDVVQMLVRDLYDININTIKSISLPSSNILRIEFNDVSR